MADTSKITTDLQVDPAKPLDANYQFDLHDRRYIDNQAIGSQRHLVQCVLDGKFGTYGFLNADSEDVVAGDCLCFGGANTLFKITADTIADSGAVAGVVLADASAGTRVRYAACGYLTQEITGLAAGSAQPVRVNTSTGRLEKVVSYGVSDYPAGVANEFGGVTLLTGSSSIAEVSGLDFLGTDLATLSVSDANYNVTSGNWAHRYMVISGSPTTDHDLILTGDLVGERVFVNNTAHDWRIKYSSGLNVVLTPGDYAVVYGSGSNIVRVASPAITGLVSLAVSNAEYDVSNFDWQHRYLVLGGTVSAPQNLVFTNDMVGERVVVNGTASDWTVKYASGLVVVIPAGGYAIVYGSGNNFVRVSTPYIDGVATLSMIDATYNVTDYDWQHRYLSLAGSLTTPQNLVFTGSMIGERVIVNATGQTITVKYSSGITVPVLNGEYTIVYGSGSNFIQVGVAKSAIVWSKGTKSVKTGSVPTLFPTDPTLGIVAFDKGLGSTAYVTVEDQTGDNATIGLAMYGQNASPDATGGNVTGGGIALVSGRGTVGDGSDDGESAIATYSGQASVRCVPGLDEDSNPTAGVVATGDYQSWAQNGSDAHSYTFRKTTNLTGEDTVIASFAIPTVGAGHQTFKLVAEVMGQRMTGGFESHSQMVSQVYSWNGSAFVEVGTTPGGDQSASFPSTTLINTRLTIVDDTIPSFETEIDGFTTDSTNWRTTIDLRILK